MPLPQVTYPLDQTGTAVSNLVQNELHSVNEAHFKDYFFLVPNFAPFFVDNFQLNLTVGDVTTPLTEDVDFSFALQYVTGTRVTGKPMYGAVTLHNLNMNGILSMTYQTIGGNQISDRLAVLTLLADKAYNPRTTIWDLLTTTPTAFPPTPHYQDYDSFFGQEEVVQALGQIRDAILQNGTLTADQMNNFLAVINSGVLDTFVRKTGDTLTGPLILAGNPTDSMHPVTLSYFLNNSIDQTELNSALSQYYNTNTVDSMVNTKVNKTGDTMTGYLTLYDDPLYELHATTKQYVDRNITTVQDQINGVQAQLDALTLDAVTKQYVDDRFAELYAYINSLAGIR